MKVIKTEDTVGWNLKRICTKCDSELEMDVYDIQYRYINGDIRDPGYDEYSVECPVCKDKIIIPLDKLPKLVRLTAQKVI